LLASLRQTCSLDPLDPLACLPKSSRLSTPKERCAYFKDPCICIWTPSHLIGQRLQVAKHWPGVCGSSIFNVTRLQRRSLTILSSDESGEPSTGQPGSKDTDNLQPALWKPYRVDIEGFYSAVEISLPLRSCSTGSRETFPALSLPTC